MCDNCRARGLQCVFELAGDIRPSLAEKIAINRRNALLGASHPAVRMAREMALAPRGANTWRHLQQHHMAFRGSRDGVTDVPRSSCQNAPSTVMFDPVRPAIQDRGEVKKDVDAGVLDGASSGHTGRGNEGNTKGQCLMRWCSKMQHAEASSSGEGSVSALCTQLCSCEILSRSEPDIDCYKAV
ncbi:hypothetical protein VFPFJ_00014 [Purpureocillium lilacinum]|uniref:Uncharacterized protein n=1 Tax=Purpureocillium lilacinum TaxID=33203 RepID=A0A179HTU3_PURLI|nr:hypothetical protein VFPFJ_00014 [Purpureocillium lilacinum]OAQ93906.1 hypothetical protein VFPFJ_00014 [Purpureocillium lilacinum]